LKLASGRSRGCKNVDGVLPIVHEKPSGGSLGTSDMPTAPPSTTHQPNQSHIQSMLAFERSTVARSRGHGHTDIVHSLEPRSAVTFPDINGALRKQTREQRNNTGGKLERTSGWRRWYRYRRLGRMARTVG
jgi:hypothetical protein